MRRVILVALMALLASAACAQAPFPPVPRTHTAFQPAEGPRTTAFISDLHMGLGRDAAGRWASTEDFRWRNALKGFLDHLSAQGGDAVDLVIVGDAFEFWQLPPELKCQGIDADRGCTIAEMARLAAIIATAHADSLADLRDFAARGQNRLYILPGNHDATLLYTPVWEPIAQALGVDGGRVAFVDSGILSLRGGRFVIEHGHQIGQEVNRYKQWPDILKPGVDGTWYVERPWGELFVQRLFNAEEASYPIIDNLSPESAGARYRMADRGLWNTAGDIAEFLAFNILETSLVQKAAVLGGHDPKKPIVWDVAIGRSMGRQLFLLGLPADDPFRVQAASAAPEAATLGLALDALAKNKATLPDDAVRALCERLAVVRSERLCLPPGDLGGAIASWLIPRRWVMSSHVGERQKQFSEMSVFIYGHTHRLEVPWEVDAGGKPVTVLNTGAFLRVVNEESFLARAAQKSLTPEAALRELSVGDLAPCYTVALAKPDDTVPRVMQWRMAEDAAAGKFVRVGEAECQ